MGEPKDEPCSKQSVALREYLEEIIQLRFAATSKAQELYQSEVERRLQGLNELRREVTDDRSEFVKREVFDIAIQESRTRAELIATEKAKLESRVSVIETRLFTWLSALGFFLLLVQILLRIFVR